MSVGRSGELERRLVHAAGTVIPAPYLAGLLTWEQTRWVVGAGLVAALALEGLRLSVGVDWIIFERLTRRYEESHLAGYALYLVGIVVALGFEPAVSIPAILMLTVADPIAGYGR